MNLAQDLPEAAEEPLKKAQSLDPSSGAVLYGLGRVALAKRDYAGAIRYSRALSRSGRRRAGSITRSHWHIAESAIARRPRSTCGFVARSSCRPTIRSWVS